ncbi:MAG TPA: NF041680 family putative transposase [Actinomycetota bacterium]|nr:NF041680 family putative transposase [Actinomycetota bacterium]
MAAPLSVLPSARPAYPDHSSTLARLAAFRAGLHACCTRRADALVDLTDALLSAPGPVASLPQLSLEPAHRRGWGSTYAALARGRIDAERLRDLLAGCRPPADPVVFAVDVTTWPRCDAECSPERGYYYHPSRHSAGQPIVAGWAFQWIAQVSFGRDSWTAPVDARRLHPLDDTDHTAAGQVRALLARLPAGGPVPWFVFDAGYDSAQLSLDLAEAPVAVLVRLRADRCFYHDPPPRPPGAIGRPRRHDAKFNLADPATWPAPTATLICQDDQYGTVTVTAWAGLHPKQHRHPGHGSGGPRPIVRGTILRVQVQRIPAKTRPPKVLWLWWAGPGQPDLDLAWRAYVRRFDLEHTVRFAKQTLGWTTPRLRTPAQAERWTWLVLAAYTQLRLARPVVADQRLAWERPRPPGQLSPYRVRRGFPRLLCALGSPAAAPKPSGRPPGRPKGHCSGPAPRYPAVKKPTTKPKKKPATNARAA